MEEMQSSSRNSFLNEIDRNLNITSDIRREIEKRYNSSQVNKTYKFPRVFLETNPTGSNTTLIMYKKRPTLAPKINQSMTSIYLSNQLTRKLPDLSRRITMKNRSQKQLDYNNNLSSSYVLAPPSDLKVRKKLISLSTKSFKFRVKSMNRKPMFNDKEFY